MERMMKAFMVYEPFRYEVTSLPVPEVKKDEVLVKVGAAAICHSDIDIIEGRRKHLISFPRITGHEFAGTVVETGDYVKGFKPGDRVASQSTIWCGFCQSCRQGSTNTCLNFSELGTMENGGFAEYAAVPYRMLHKFEKISMNEASNAEPAGNALQAVEAADILPGERVAVIGPGPIGLYALQFARLKGPEMLIMVGTRNNRLKVAAQLGATHTINVKETDGVEEIMNITAGKGINKIIQCATTRDAFELSLKVTAVNSKIIVEGFNDSNDEIPVNFNNFIIKPMSIIGVAGVSAMTFEKTMSLMENGYIDAKPVITHTFPLDRILEGFEILKSRNDGVIKAVINTQE